MTIITTTVLSEGAGIINEDIVGINNRAFWVMDGATGLWDTQITGKSDAQWFVKEFDKYFTRTITKRQSLKDIVRGGIQHVKRRWQKILSKQGISHIPPYAEPSSSLILVRFNAEYTSFEYLVLGDSVLSFIIDKSYSKVIKDNTLEKLDYKAISALNSYLKRGYSFELARKNILSILREHRSLKNTPNGYWVLSFQEEALNHAIYGKEQITKTAYILALTDGLGSIVSAYKLFDSYYELIKYVSKSKELLTIYKLVRNIEKNDPNCVKFPRLKPSDDASGIYTEVSLI